MHVMQGEGPVDLTRSPGPTFGSETAAVPGAPVLRTSSGAESSSDRRDVRASSRMLARLDTAPRDSRSGRFREPMAPDGIRSPFLDGPAISTNEPLSWRLSDGRFGSGP